MLSSPTINANRNSNYSNHPSFGMLEMDKPLRKRIALLKKSPESKAIAIEIKNAINASAAALKGDKNNKFILDSFHLNSPPDSVNFTINRETRQKGRFFDSWLKQGTEDLITVSRKNIPEGIKNHIDGILQQEIIP